MIIILIFLGDGLRVSTFSGFLGIFRTRIFDYGIFRVFARSVRGTVLFGNVGGACTVMFARIVRFFALSGVLNFYEIDRTCRRFMAIRAEGNEDYVSAVFQATEFAVNVRVLIINYIAEFSFDSFIFYFACVCRVLQLGLVLDEFSSVRQASVR